MNGITSRPPSPSQPMPRDLLLSLVDAAMRTGELKYARRLSTAWLASYPGDLHVSLLQARAFYKEISPELQLHALPIVEEICRLDPEFLEAQELLAEVRQLAGSGSHFIAKACANALSHGHTAKTGNSKTVSSWAKYVYEARSALKNVRSGDYQQIEKGEYYIHKALVENPDTPLAAIIHLRLIESKSSMPKLAIRSLAQIYHERWPDCLQFLLTLSNELMESGDSNEAVKMLHQAVSKDVTGQVPKRMWGDHHQYSAIWPSTLEASNTGFNSPQNIPVPAAVASFLGWNQLASGPAVLDEAQFAAGATGKQPAYSIPDYFLTDTPAPANESLNIDPGTTIADTPGDHLQSELERMADDLKRPHIAREDGRFPVYVIFTTRGGLEKLYGPTGFQLVDAELKKLVNLVHGRKINQEYWGSLLFYADDADYTLPFDLAPAPHNEPWQLKLVLSDLDTALGKRGERIGAVLIVGGPEIVPFHNLPNPVEDADVDVQSDNPYATRDSNYFISDWQVGRVSGGSGPDAGTLISMLKALGNRHDPRATRYAWYRRALQYLQELFRRGLSKNQSSFGYTAAVWRRASEAVFQAIGVAGDMLVSPPVHSCDPIEASNTSPAPGKKSRKVNSCFRLPAARLGYFNLHGVPDGSEWYGQCDPMLSQDGPDFPIAMRPQDIRGDGSAPRLVFTEACYGANISGKTVEEAISLKLLASGTYAVIGSTCISYGSLSTPLTSADLLGRVFWSLLQEGFTAGESLRRAKIHLTREMNRRQGFLDAEDQKTLISFVLFGDPLAQPFQVNVNPKSKRHLSDSTVPVATVCEHTCDENMEIPVSLETISHLKSIVEQYLPGMSDAQVRLSQEQQACAELCSNCITGKKCSFSRTKALNNSTVKSHRHVVTLSKNYQREQHLHRQYARLTLDDQGKIIKMVISH